MRSSIALSPGEHAVHFYEGDADLLPAVLEQLGSALRAGDAAIVLATPEHRIEFETGLRALGTDVAAAEAAGSLVWRHAADVAAELLVDGHVDPGCFESVIGSLVRTAAGDHSAVHAYGEVVAVLWSKGEVVAALELEQLWNALLAEVPMSLLCGYPVDLVTQGEHSAGFPDVCAEHTRLMGGAPIAAPAEASRRFPGTPLAVRHARAFVADTLRGWARADLVDAGALVVTELATNAVRHAGSDFSVALVRSNDIVRVAVGDARPVAPCARVSSFDEPGGRGLLLVDGMSTRWGHELVGDGKLVWAELAGGSEGRAS